MLECLPHEASSVELELPIVDVALSGALPQPPTAAKAEPVDASTECALLYTSGSTGRPKGCVLSNEYFIVCAQN